MKGYLKILATQLGPLRLMLVGLTLMLIILVPKPGTPSELSGWRVISTLIAPATAPIVFFVLLLDLLMARVWMSDTTGDERKRYKIIMLVNALLALAVLLAWLPFFLAIGGVL